MQLKGLSSLDCVLIDPNPSSEQKHRVEMKDGKRRQQLNYTEKRDLEDDFMSSIVAEMRKKIQNRNYVTIVYSKQIVFVTI